METSVAFRAAMITIIMASPFLGCFAATVVRVSRTGESVLKGRSQCQSCGHALKAIDLIPLLSALLRRGACRYCRTAIPSLYPALELSFLAAALWASQMEDNALIVPGVLLGWTLLSLIAFDVTAFVLPNFLTYPLLLAGLGTSAINGPQAAFASAAGALAGGLSLLLVKYSYRLIKKRDGLGMGDVKLFAGAGAWVGIGGLPQTLLVASLLGLIYAAFYLRGPAEAMALKKVPFGAGLCLGLWITWMSGSGIA